MMLRVQLGSGLRSLDGRQPRGPLRRQSPDWPGSVSAEVSMISTRVALLVVCGVLLAAGCSSAPPSASESAAPASTRAATQHVVAGPIGLDAPATWHVRPGLLNPSGNVTFAYLSPPELPSECQDTGQGGVCHPWPVVQLVPGGLVVAVRQNGMPGSQAPGGGAPIMVGGRPARRIRGPADEGCRAIGGSVSIEIVLPATGDRTGWSALDACLAGPDVSVAEAAFANVVASVDLAGAAASP
jgi:hypothetical protein